MKVISVSRRTDVPAFYAPWFMNRIRAGFCHWINPYSRQIYRISLEPQDCIGLVFWTRNPRPLLPHLAELDERGYKYYFMFTVLGYPRSIETHRPDLDAVLRTFQVLSDKVSPDRVFWRYDPIVMSSLTPAQYHLDRFGYIAQRLAGYTHRCIYSFLTPYNKVERNLSQVSSREGITFESPSDSARHGLLGEMVGMARGYGLQLYSCCEQDHAQVEGIQRNSCVDLQVLRQVTSDPSLDLKSRPTRALCGCVESVDIGSYDTCLFGCAYCYATNHRETAVKHHAAHDPGDTILYRPRQLGGIDLDTWVHPLS